MLDWLFLIVTVWAVFTLAFAVSRLTDDYSVVDIFWGLSFIALGHVVIGWSPEHTTAKWMYLLIVLWGTRLSVHILSRKLIWPGEDFRYQALRASWKTPLRPYVTVFLFQGFLSIVIALPLILLAQDPNASSVGLFTVIGSLVAILGLAIETEADYQLLMFKKSHSQSPKQRCEEGLWSISRHPNYLGEVIFWLGLAVMSLSANLGWLALLSPVLLGFLLVKVTGIPLIDKHINQYESKQSDIPLLIPKFQDALTYVQSCWKKKS